MSGSILMLILGAALLGLGILAFFAFLFSWSIAWVDQHDDLDA